MTYDAIIIGKGPAGISASLYLARAGYSALVIGKDAGALERAEKIENYYGFPSAVSGIELVNRGIAQAERFGVSIKSEEVVHVGIEDNFLIKTTENEYKAKILLLATGKARTTLRVPGFEALRGKGISFCATCDGFLYRGKKLAVIGTGDYAVNELSELLRFTHDITLFTHGEEITAAALPDDIPVVSEKIAAFEGSDHILGIRTEPGTLYSVEGCFVAIGTAGAADFAAKTGIEVTKSDIVVDSSFMTNIPGIFAAGDCVGGFLQIAKAVSDGAHAAKGMISYLKKN